MPRRHRSRALLMALAVALLAMTGCGDDDDSAQDRYCEAGESLRSSVAALGDLDLVAEGTDGLTSAVDEIRDELGTLREAADQAAADDVEALEQAVDALNGAISDLGGELTSENASAVGAAVEGVRDAAGAVFDTLSDC